MINQHLHAIIYVRYLFDSPRFESIIHKTVCLRTMIQGCLKQRSTGSTPCECGRWLKLKIPSFIYISYCVCCVSAPHNPCRDATFRKCQRNVSGSKSKMYVMESVWQIGSWMGLVHTILSHWGRDKMDTKSQTKFSCAFSWMKMYEFRLKFHWSLCS